MIYHFIAFGQFLLFMGSNVWIFLGLCFADRFIAITIYFLYPTALLALIYIWIIAATGTLGEIRWWPSGDRIIRLVPPSITNETMTKCRWSLLFILRALTRGLLAVIQRQVKALRRLPSICPAGVGGIIVPVIISCMVMMVFSWLMHFAGTQPAGSLAAMNVILLLFLVLCIVFIMLGLWLFRLAVALSQSSLDLLLGFLKVSGERPLFNSNV